MLCYWTLTAKTEKNSANNHWRLHADCSGKATSLCRKPQTILQLSENIRHHWCPSKATEELKAPATASPQNTDMLSHTYVFLKTANVKYKKEAHINPKLATYQLLCIFPFILSPDIYYFLQSHCRNSHHCLTSLDRIEEENQIICLRLQWAKKSGWKITQNQEEDYFS